MPGTSRITMSDQPDHFIIRMAESGRYGSTREEVRSAL